MNELTDSMIIQDSLQRDVGVSIFGLIFLIIILIIGIYIITKSRKGKDSKKTKIYIIIITVIILIMMIIPILKLTNIDIYGKNINLIISKIDKKYTEHGTSDPGTRKTYYYVEIKGYKDKEINIAKEKYDEINEGEEVYVVLYNEDEPISIYEVDKYEYVGNRFEVKDTTTIY